MKTALWNKQEVVTIRYVHNALLVIPVLSLMAALEHRRLSVASLRCQLQKGPVVRLCGRTAAKYTG